MPSPPNTLARIPLFRTLDPPALNRLDTACAWRRVAADEWILDEAAHGTDVLFLLQGHVGGVVTAAGRYQCMPG
jgi:CRP/FNR family cyclic AMP-dependent transcriptional regulator